MMLLVAQLLVVSLTADRAAPQPLEGRTLPSPAYLWLRAGSAAVTQVAFRWDATPGRTDTSAPWDAVGGTATVAEAVPVLAPGRYTLTADVTQADGIVRTVSALFRVAPEPASTTPPISVAFAASPDHATTVPPEAELHAGEPMVTEYLVGAVRAGLEYPDAELAIGKPAPDETGTIHVELPATWIASLPRNRAYEFRVTTRGPLGATISEPSSVWAIEPSTLTPQPPAGVRWRGQ